MPKLTNKSANLKLRKAGGNIQKRIPFIKLLYLSVGINVFVVILAYLLMDNLPPEIPLYYGLPRGTALLAERNKIIIPSLVAVIFIIINSMVAFFIKDNFLKKALVITGFVLSIFSLTTTLKIMLLVGNFQLF